MSWAAMAVVFLALFLLASQAMKRSESYQLAEAFLFDHPEVQSRLGPRLRGDLLPAGNCHSGGGRTRADFEIDLRGDSDKGTAVVVLTREGREWSVASAVLALRSGDRVDLLEGRATGAPESGAGAADIESLRADALARPDDFEAQRRLDYALAREGRFQEIIPIWDTYLLRHPGDGRAWLERGGTWYHLKDLVKAREDAEQACELGVPEGCRRAEMLRRRRAR